MSVEVQLQLVFADADVQALEIAVELVNDAGEVAVDIDLRVAGCDLQSCGPRVVVHNRAVIVRRIAVPIRIRIRLRRSTGSPTRSRS